MFQKKLFGQRLLELREKRALSQKAVADILGITRTQISDMENGKSNMNYMNADYNADSKLHRFDVWGLDEEEE